MPRRPFEPPSLAYHPDLLVVRFRQRSADAGRRPGFADGAPGRTLLDRLSATGRIRRITQVHPGRASGGDRLGFAGADPLAGTRLVELASEADASDLHAALRADRTVEAVSRVPIRHLLLPRRARVAGGPGGGGSPAPDRWNHASIRLEDARRLPAFREPSAIRVRVLDSGVDDAHPELAGHVAPLLPDLPTPIPGLTGLDRVGHGTHVAGIIGADRSGPDPLAGLCRCDLSVAKVLDDRPDLDVAHDRFVYYVRPELYWRALAQCLEDGVQVVNLSIGGRGAPDVEESRLIAGLIGAGVHVVAAMGNERADGSPTSYPAAIDGVVAVGAIDAQEAVATFSSAGAHLALCAPGVDVRSTMPTYPGESGFGAKRLATGETVQGNPRSRALSEAVQSGTSMAAPHVTAALAMLLAAHGPHSPVEARTRLMDSAAPTPGMGGARFHPDYGAGRLDLVRLLGEGGPPS